MEARRLFPTLFSPSWTETGNYTCEFCGKQYKYYTPYQEHVALHAPISEYRMGDGEAGGGAGWLSAKALEPCQGRVKAKGALIWASP